MNVDPELLAILACPACKSEVKLEGEKLICQSAECALRFPIRDDIPIMLIEEAEKANKG